MKPDRAEAALLLQTVGEVHFGQKVRVSKVRVHRAVIARVTLMLHDDGGVWERTFTVVDAPEEARGGLESSLPEGAGRPVPLSEIPEELRERIDEVVEEQRSLGYGQVVTARVRVHEEELRSVRYRAEGRGTVTAYVGTAPARVVGYDAGRGLSGFTARVAPSRRLPASIQKQVGAGLVIFGWFLFLAWRVYSDLY